MLNIKPAVDTVIVGVFVEIWIMIVVSTHGTVGVVVLFIV